MLFKRARASCVRFLISTGGPNGTTLQNEAQKLTQELLQGERSSPEEYQGQSHARRHPPLGHMACYDPRSTAGFFSVTKMLPDPMPTTLPCGQCIGCRVDKARDWSIRLQHEAQSTQEAGSDSLALTLTYATLPAGGSLNRKDIQDFFKRLRSWANYHQGAKLRYYQCGEYGEALSRPHHHAVVFGLSVPDRTVWRQGRSVQYVSQTLTDLWGHGFVTFGDATPSAMGYIAGYVTKKLRDDPTQSRYELLDESTGELRSVRPEFSTMSRRPGIGSAWFDRYWQDVYPRDVVVYRSRNKYLEAKPPRYYDMLLERRDPELFARVRQARSEFEFPKGERTTQRLNAKSVCAAARLNPRGFTE